MEGKNAAVMVPNSPVIKQEPETISISSSDSEVSLDALDGLLDIAGRLHVYFNTVDSRYLEIQGTLWNTLRYPYFDISDLRNYGKQLIEQPPLTEWIFNLTLKLEI